MAFKKKSFKQGSYGKKPLWQWLLIYVVIAAVVYGVVYYLFMHEGVGGGGYGY